MKKLDAKKKLTLSRETLSVLDPASLKKVDGGTITIVFTPALTTIVTSIVTTILTDE